MSAWWIGLIVVLAASAGFGAWLMVGRNREVVSEVETLNPDGGVGTALVVYHPGRSDFQRRVFAGFAEGLVAGGWQVEMTDKWLHLGNPWEIPRPEIAYEVKLGGHTEGYYDNWGRYRTRCAGSMRTPSFMPNKLTPFSGWPKPITNWYKVLNWPLWANWLPVQPTRSTTR